MAKTYAHYNHDGDGDSDYATKDEAIVDAEEIAELHGDDALCYTIYELDENDIITAAWDEGETYDGSKVGQPIYNV